MKSYKVVKNQRFIGRSVETQYLERFVALSEAAILVLYGRRRIGKTELVEQTLGHHVLLKFEGLEAQSQQAQIEQVLYQAAQYFEMPRLAQLKLSKWVEVFDLLADCIGQESCILYFEELQWLANYDAALISALKFAWDNRFRHNANLKIILCGSSPAFMINDVLHSKALYNRSQYEMHLQPFSLKETQLFLPKLSHHEVFVSKFDIGRYS